MKMWLNAVALIVCLAVLFPPVLNAQEVIKWQTYHRPPGSIKAGVFEEQGFIDKVLTLVIADLPEYSHQRPTTSLARALADIEAGKQVCHPALHVTEERKQHMYFSQPAIINPTNRLIGDKAHSENLLVNNEVDIENFPSKSTFALIKDRSYSGGYDEFLASHISSEQQIYISSDTLDTLFQLIASKRVDFTIAYPFELQHFKTNNPNIGKNLVSFKIQGSPAYSVGSVACPKNSWGKLVIKRVDEVLDKLKPTKAYHDALTTWWEHERDNKEFQVFYRDVFIPQKSH